MVELAERSAVMGAQVPRILVVPEGVDHPRWAEVVEFVEATGTALDPWQLEVMRVGLMRQMRAEPSVHKGTTYVDQWAAFRVAVCAPRQNGKNVILEMRELVGCLLLGEKLIVHSAHLADTSEEAFRRLDELIDANEWLSKQVRHVWRANGKASIEFMNGNRIRFRTRTRGGGRGFSGSPVIFDEPMYLPEVSMGSIMPVVSAQPDPQVWYTGSAVDQTVHPDGVVFARVRDRALKGESSRLAYFEWSLDVDDPEDLDAEVAADPAVWAATQPALGRRITAEYIAAEIEELAWRTFAVERLGVGDWPPVDGTADQVIPLVKWNALIDEKSKAPDPVCFAFDVALDRSWAAIGAAGMREDGKPHVEVVEHRRGTAWLPARLAELAETHETTGEVFCDSYGAGGTLIPQLEELGVVIQSVTAKEHANACGLMFDLVEEERLRHLGTAQLTDALKGAAKRPLGEAWAWHRKNSRVDISPLVACTLALWGVSVSRPVPRRRWAPMRSSGEQVAA